nr:MAG TPA: hypothetical protein [Caudoviricetes sp.]
MKRRKTIFLREGQCSTRQWLSVVSEETRKSGTRSLARPARP